MGFSASSSPVWKKSFWILTIARMTALSVCSRCRTAWMNPWALSIFCCRNRAASRWAGVPFLDCAASISRNSLLTRRVGRPPLLRTGTASSPSESITKSGTSCCMPFPTISLRELPGWGLRRVSSARAASASSLLMPRASGMRSQRLAAKSSKHSVRMRRAIMTC